MIFQPLASSSAGNACLVTSRGTRILLECGLPMATLRRRLPCLLGELSACLITHEHGDHARSASELLRRGVPVHCSAGTADALGLVGASVLRAGEGAQIGEVAITPIAAVHDAAEPLAFVLDDGADRLLFATDTAALPWHVPGLTLAAIEANYAVDLLPDDMPAPQRQRLADSHLSLAGALEWLARTDRSRLREIHLLHLSRDHSDEARFVGEIQAATGIPCYVAPE